MLGCRVLRVLLVLALVPVVATPAPRHCLDEPGGKLIVDETLVGVANPDGGENQLTASVCWPLIERPGLLFDYTNLQVGAFDYLSPIYVQQGAFVAVTPLSPLVLRAEAAGVAYWSLPLDGAGYYAVDGYRADVRESSLPASRGSAATGVEVSASATVRGEVELSPGLAVAATDVIDPEYWAVGSGAFWFDERRDVILARHDWLMKNTASILVALARGRSTLRLGAFDDLTLVPRAHYVANIVGGIAMIELRHVTRDVHELSAFVRIGDYTEHAFRTGATALFGISMVWERLRD